MKRMMIFTAVSLFGLMAMAVSSARGEAGGKDAVENGWDAKWFAYDKPAKLVVEESTPTAGQVNFWGRPTPEDRHAPDPKATGPAKPLTIGPSEIIHLRFKDVDGNVVPALLCKPHGKPGPFPVVIATHGFTSNKAQVCAQVGPALLQQGFAVLAADMPKHGERPGEPAEIMDHSDWRKTFANWREAVIDDRQLIDLASQRSDLDTRRGVVLVGYSMGSWISSVVGPADARVKAMALMVGGAADLEPEVLKIPQVAATDPRLAIRHFAGRPILMLNGRSDFIVGASLTRRLWDAAPQPKQQLWYDSGHFLPAQAYHDAAEWIAKMVKK